MLQPKHPVVITTLKSKAHLVREVALRQNVPFTESVVPEDESLLRFSFGLLDEASTLQLTAAVPSEAYAFSAKYLGSTE